MGIFDMFFDPGGATRRSAENQTRQAVLGNFGYDSPYATGGFNAHTGQFSSQLSPELAGIQNQLLNPTGAQDLSTLFNAFGGSTAANNLALGQLGGQVAGAAGGPFDASRSLQRASRLGAYAQLPTLFQNLDQVAGDRLSLLRQQAAPFEQQAMGQLNQRLFGTGSGAVTGPEGNEGSLGGGALAAAFSQGLGRADLERQAAANEFAMGRQNQAANLFSGLTNVGQGLNQQGYQQALGLGQFQSNLLGQQFAQNQNLFGAGLQTAGYGQQQLANQIAGLQGLQGLALNPFQAALQANVARSNSQLGVGQNLAGIAADTPNVFGDLAAGALQGWATGGFALASDMRLKDDLMQIDVEPLTGLPIYVWSWNQEARRNGMHKTPPIGLVAQEVEEKYPEAITMKNGYRHIDYSKLHDLVGA